jgi:hypothetical protein
MQHLTQVEWLYIATQNHFVPHLASRLKLNFQAVK